MKKIILEPNSKREIVHGSLELRIWRARERGWVEINSVSKRLIDRHFIERAAAALFCRAIAIDKQVGKVIDLACLPEVLFAAGLSDIALQLPSMNADAPTPPTLRRGATLRPGQIELLRQRIDEGATQKEAASQSGMTTREARMICRGEFPAHRLPAASQERYFTLFVLNPLPRRSPPVTAAQFKSLRENMALGTTLRLAAAQAGISARAAGAIRLGEMPTGKLAPDARALYLHFFMRTPGERKSHVPTDVDMRNAAVVRQLHALLIAEPGLSIVAAGQRLGISADKAYRLRAGPKRGMAPKTAQAWQQTFGAPAQAVEAPQPLHDDNRNSVFGLWTPKPALGEQQIRTLHRLLRAGESQAHAARESGMEESLASRLRRGLVPMERLSPSAQAAFADTFGADPFLCDSMVRAQSKAVDERNAALLHQLFDVMKEPGVTLADAARKIGAAYELALRLRRGPRRTKMATRTVAAWAKTFGGMDHASGVADPAPAPGACSPDADFRL